MDVRDYPRGPCPEGSTGKGRFDVPLALAIVGLGVLIIIAPSSIPELLPSM